MGTSFRRTKLFRTRARQLNRFVQFNMTVPRNNNCTESNNENESIRTPFIEFPLQVGG